MRERWRFACSKSAVSEIAHLKNMPPIVFAYNFLMNGLQFLYLVIGMPFIVFIGSGV